MRTWLLATAVILVCSVNGFGQQAVVDQRREYNVKAASVFGFCSFVTWPDRAFDDKQGDFVLGVYGESPIEATLQAIADRKKSVQHRRLKVIHCRNIEDIQQCHVTFVSDTVTQDQQKKIIDLTENAPVMLVGETNGFGSDGGVANFYITDGRVQFELNADEASRKGLKLDAQLLKLARIVRTDVPRGP